MSISSEKEALIGRVFETYLTEYHHDDILQLLAEANEENHHPLIVNAMTLFETNMEVGDYFNAYPHDVLAIFDKVLHRTAMTLSQDTSLNLSSGQRAREQRMRQTFHARITGLPVCPELTRDTIPRSRDVGHFLSVTGTVIRTSVAKVLEYERDYMCSKCRHVFTMQADFDQFYTFVPPLTCPNPDGCNSFKFTCLSDGSGPAACRDYQEIKIQEQAQRLLVGSIPRSMVVVLEDDLVDTCKSGDDVTVYGVMCQRWRPFYDNTRCDVELVLKANNIEVNNQQAASALLMKDVQQEFEDFWKSYEHDPIAGRNQILLSLCPQVFGMYVIKLAVAMVLAGGVQRIDSSGTKIRGECHMLLVGDPGTGKSQFLKYAAKIMPRSVLTAGIGSTSAGLTVAAVKDGGDWHLEAGALVLSDGGLCCIDEFNSIKEHDRISIHEAMEQQSISVAKAGMVCKLNTRSTILAAANPKGQYDPNEPLSVNVALPSPLLSRFDLVLVLLDTRNTEWDRIISSFILEDRGLPSDSSSLWSMEKMKAYFSVIRQLQPQVSEEANSILTRYYQMQRQRDGRNAARTTIRMLESLSRLAEAHARLMYRQTVTIEDAVTAVSVMECSMQGGALLGNVNALLTSFPAEPSQQYQTQCQVLLEGLNLPLLLHKEMDRLARLKSSTEASQFDPLPDNHQHQLTDTNTINIPSYLDVNSEGSGHVSRESGLDWFHSITPSVSPDDQTSPIITSTQLNSTRKPNWSNMSALDKQLNCQSEKDIDSALNHDGTVTSASEGLNRNDCDRQKDQQRPRSSRFVFQKVSKNVRGRRLRELERNNQQCDGDEAGRHGESVVSTGLPAKNVTDVLNRTSDSHSSSTVLSAKTRPLNKLAQENQSSDKRNQTGTKTISAVLGEKMAAETDTGKSLHTQLSDFIFKPKQMRPLLHDVSVELHSECNPGNSEFGPHTGSNASKEKSHGPDEAITETKQNEHQHNQKEENRRKQLSSISEVGEGGSDNSRGLETNVFSPPKDSLVNRKRKDKENLCKQQRTRLSTADEVIVDDFTGTTPVRSNLPISESASGHMKSTVASIARAKLSQFSFTCTSEPTTTAQTRKEDNPPEVVEKGSLRSLTKATAETPRANPEVKKSVCHEHGTGKTSVAPPGQGQGTEQNVMNWSPVHCENTVNLKKRKCFELGPPPAGTTGFRGGFSGLSLFNSVELSNDVFDTDWDQELPKKAKV